MPRARNIKPSFFKNEILIELPFEARLLFIGLWTLADREGRLEDRPKRIKMEIFPADNIDVNLSLQQLHDAGFIKRYALAPDEHQSSTVQKNNSYIQILKFKKHQHPHVNEAASIIPAPDEHQSSTVPIGLLTDSFLLNPETPLLKPDCVISAHTIIFENLIFEKEFIKISKEAGLEGEAAEKCWKKFIIHFSDNPPEDVIKAWKKWVLNEYLPYATPEEKLLEGRDLLIQQVGIANWKRQQRMSVDSQELQKLEKWELENGPVTWNCFEEWQKQQPPP